MARERSVAEIQAKGKRLKNYYARKKDSTQDLKKATTYERRAARVTDVMKRYTKNAMAAAGKNPNGSTRMDVKVSRDKFAPNIPKPKAAPNAAPKAASKSARTGAIGKPENFTSGYGTKNAVKKPISSKSANQLRSMKAGTTVRDAGFGGQTKTTVTKDKNGGVKIKTQRLKSLNDIRQQYNRLVARVENDVRTGKITRFQGEDRIHKMYKIYESTEAKILQQEAPSLKKHHDLLKKIDDDYYAVKISHEEAVRQEEESKKETEKALGSSIEKAMSAEEKKRVQTRGGGMALGGTH